MIKNISSYFLLLSIYCLPLIGNDLYKLATFDKDNPRSFHIQNALILNDEIPKALQNLPYATYPTNPLYNTFRFNFNKRFNLFPKALIAPRTNQEAIFVLKTLKKNKLDFSIRSGGHCFEPGSLSSEYIIDLRNFNTIKPNIAKEEVKIGAGCLLNRVIEELGAINYVIPTGTCPTVCVTGLTLGGGIGLLTRTYGLTCDSVKSITLLTANAKIIEVSQKSHPDLFWALKGGGNGSYGIVLGFTFKMHYLPTVSYFELVWKWDSKQASHIIKAWQKWVKTLSSSISTSLRLTYKEGSVGLKIIGIKANDKTFTEWIEPFKKFEPSVEIHKESYLKTVKYWSSEPTLPFNKIKSKILEKPVSKKVIKHIVHYLDDLKKEKPDLRVFLNFDGFGGAMPHFDNSFPFKNDFGWWYQAIYWPRQTQDEEALALINKIYNKTSSHVSKYSYANATDYELGDKYLKAYYKDNIERLITIKTKYDPTNLFHWKQSIPLKK